MPAKKACNDESEVAHALGVVAHELHTLGVVAHGVQHASQRRAGEGKHGSRADKAIHGNQVVHLQARAEIQPEELAVDPVRGDTALAAEELGKHQRHGGHQLS